MTQFGRALDELNIEIICANSAPAKGRVERAHQTLQVRLVKEMRLAGICDIEAANAFLPGFMAKHNARFAVEAFNTKDLHRPLAIHDNLDATNHFYDAPAAQDFRTTSSNAPLPIGRAIKPIRKNNLNVIGNSYRVVEPSQCRRCASWSISLPWLTLGISVEPPVPATFPNPR